MRASTWQLVEPGAPLSLRPLDLPDRPEGDGIVVEVAGCGVCHTDVGFVFDGVRTSHALPLTLGHEIAGTVVLAGPAAERLLGQKVVLPAVAPCGACALCASGRPMICRAQRFLGSDDHGGFASHVFTRAVGAAVVDPARLARSGLELAELSVVADAVTTPFQAIHRAQVGTGDVAIFVGIGGVGGFGVQIARALGAHVIALDVDERRLARIAEHGASLTIPVKGREPKDLRKQIAAHVASRGLPALGFKIFECSGHPAGQDLAFQLLNHGAHLSIIGYTREVVPVRLSNLMAFDATVRGNWGCAPELYPAAIDLVLSGQVALGPFIERRPMSELNAVLADLHAHKLDRRPVLIPDFAH